MTHQLPQNLSQGWLLKCAGRRCSSDYQKCRRGTSCSREVLLSLNSPVLEDESLLQKATTE